MQNIIKILKKRFSQANVIDLIGVGIFIVCLGMLALTFLRRAEYVTITLRVTNRKTFLPAWQDSPADWYINNLSAGLADKNFLGQTNVEIVDTYYYPQNTTAQTVYVKLKVRSVFNKNTGQYSYNGVPLLIGELQTFKIKDVSLQGVMIDISSENEPIEQKKFIVKGSLETQYNEEIRYAGISTYKGVRNFFADKIKPGLKATDSHGRVIAEVLEVKKTPGLKQFATNNGLLTVEDPDRTQVDLTVKFTTNKINNRYLYRAEEPLILGHYLNLDFEGFTVYITLMDVKPE
jgi:hypothetical protein